MINNDKNKEKFQDEDKSVSTALCFKVVGIEIGIFLLTLLVSVSFKVPIITYGRMMHYLILCCMMLLLWSQLQDGKITKGNQIILFAVIPICEVVLLNLIGISNAWGLLFIIIYGVVLCVKYDINLNDGSSSGGTTGKIVGKIVGKTIKDLTK